MYFPPVSATKRYFNYDPAHSPVGGGKVSTTGSIVFRAAEAYLNYMEACYMKNNSLDDTAKNYWKALRRRAKVDEDFQKTIDNTDMSKEALGDWGAYSAGELVDATLYNIRRERRCEFVSEGMRWRDLTRWRALDQVKNYIVEGFNLWGGDNHTKYPKLDAEGNPTGESNLVEAGKESPNVSAKSDSDYLRPYRIIQANNDLYNGYTWTMALYLSPVSYRELQLNAPDGKAENSYFYQNPYWPYEADGAAIK